MHIYILYVIFVFLFKGGKNVEKPTTVINTYMERSLHAALKKRFCPDETKHELAVGRYIADACCDGVIYEIQTGSLSPLRKKLEFYLENTDFNIVVVHPVAKNRRIFWMDGESGELSAAPRVSSKHENIFFGISDLYYLREFLENDRVSFCFPIMEIDEVRLLNGYGKKKKIRATSVDRLAGEIYSVEYIRNATDISDFVHPSLPDGEFTRDDLSRALKLKALKLWSVQKLLLELGILSCRQEGRKLFFKKS